MHIKQHMSGMVFMIFMFLALSLPLACSQQPSTFTPTKTSAPTISSALLSTATSLPTVSSTSTPSASPSPTPGSISQTPTPASTLTPTAPSITLPTLTPHSLTGIHLSLQECTETEHFVLYCLEVDLTVSEVIARQLESDFERITTHLKHEPSTKIDVEIYPNLESFHTAVDHQAGLEWLVGQAESGKIRMVTPLNPGPRHTFDTILQTAVHEFTHLIIDEITDNDLPAWLDEGIATYESGQRQPQFVAAQIDHNLPAITDLNFNSGTDSNTIYAFSYTVIEFIVQEFGYDYVVELVSNQGNIAATLNTSETEFEQAWQAFILAEYSQFREN